jgi:hypothetical protein
MKRLLTVSLIVLGTASGTRAQDQTTRSPGADGNAAADFAKTSAARTGTPPSGLWATVSRALPETSPAALSFRTPVARRASTALPEPASSQALGRPSAPPPHPSFNYTERESRWEFALGLALVGFRSSAFTATGVGVNSSLAYFLNNWIALEGSATSAFASTIFLNERVKYLGYTAGPRFSLGQWQRLEPWVHALFGGVHVIPQTALGGQNGFELLAGAGADYAFNPRVSARIGVDYLRTNRFGQSQNNLQGILDMVFHF